MKPIRIVLTPTRNRAVNIFLGAAVVAAAILWLLMLATYHATDPSLNTSTGEAGAAATRNLLGIFGAYLADLLLQSFGISAFLPALLMTGLGVRWMRSRQGGAIWQRVVGITVAMAFVPAAFGLLPWHILWQHLLPVEGVVGGVIAAWMHAKIGPAWSMVAAIILSGVGVYFGAAISWRAVVDGARNLSERYRNWQEERAERSLLAEDEEHTEGATYSTGLGSSGLGSDVLDFSTPPRKERGRLLSFFRKEPKPEAEDLLETPAYDSMAAHEHVVAMPLTTERKSLWERTIADYEAPVSVVPAAEEVTVQEPIVPAASTEISVTPFTMPVQQTTYSTAQPAYSVSDSYVAPISYVDPQIAAPVFTTVAATAASQFRFASEEPLEAPVAVDGPAPLPFAFAEEESASGLIAAPGYAMDSRPEMAEPAVPAFTSVPVQPEPALQEMTQVENVPQYAEPVRYSEPVRSIDNITVDVRPDAVITSQIAGKAIRPRRVSGYTLPPTSLLSAGSGPNIVREDELREEAQVLKEKCAEFGVHGQVVRINPGPMVTTYEFKPEAGVKYSKVTGLQDDLCLAMRAESILIERMAGQSTVGIQVPNHERETISLRECLESETFQRAKTKLTLTMGKDINGRMHVADLAAMPHVLIAGSTGSGKSVAINAMITSLLYRTTPQQVRLILVDPKRVELGMYEGIPHLFTPIITEAKLAANALRNAVREMERRLKLLASRSVRNIDQYNKLFDDPAPTLFEPADDELPLPYIVIIIDELADLMMLDRANVEESITRLAQMARAVGIHLVLATQRPSVDVITGLIKANVPTRISFRLASKVDSRTIIDTNGAESLLGRGDMLYMPPGTSRHTRLHAPYVSEKETAAVVEFWKSQGQAEYAEGFLDAPREERAEGGSANDGDDNDPLFDDAVKLVFEFGKASTSLLQRRLRVGYGRAAHLIDLMERDGLVGPADGSRPRELLKPAGWLAEVAAAAGGE